MRHYSIIGSLLLFGLSSLAFAVDDEGEGSRWDFGPAVKIKQSPFLGGKTSITPNVASITNKQFLSRGPILPFKRTDRHQYYIGGSFSDWDHQRGDSPDLAGMRDLDPGINLRAGSAWRNQSGVTDLEVLKDVTAHKGLQARLRYTHAPKGKKAFWWPFAELQWLSSDVTDYYVGVDADEVRFDRPLYKAGSDYAVKTGVNMEYPLSKRMTLVGGVALNHYGNKISDSPIIKRSDILEGSLGISYRWK